MNQTAVLALLAVGAYYLLSNQVSSSGTPVFKTMAGSVVNTIQCGNSVIFDVPGYTLVWLVRTKNGVQDFSGPYAVPAPAYVMNCSTDVGSYTLTAYTITPSNTQGTLLGTTNFTVTPSS